jgi:hypothetical protein
VLESWCLAEELRRRDDDDDDSRLCAPLTDFSNSDIAAAAVGCCGCSCSLGCGVRGSMRYPAVRLRSHPNVEQSQHNRLFFLSNRATSTQPHNSNNAICNLHLWCQCV